MMTRTKPVPLPRPPKPAGKYVPPSAPAGLPISHCAAKYAIAISDPMNAAARGACVPSANARPSFKVTSVTRFTFACGADGVGFVLFTPTTANDTPCCISTTAAYSSGVGLQQIFSIDTSGGGALNGFKAGIQTTQLTTLPFSFSDLWFNPSDESQSTAVQARIVSAAISVQYVGSVMDQQGIITSLSRASHQSVLVPVTTSAVSNPQLDIPGVQVFNEARYARVDDSKLWLLDSARVWGEEDYSQNDSAAGPAENPNISLRETIYPFCVQNICETGATLNTPPNCWNGGPANVVAIQGGKPGAPYVVEIVEHLEYIGKKANYGLTPTHQDAVGFGMVRQAAATLSAAHAQDPSASLPKLMLKALKESATQLGPAAARAGGAMLTAALSGGGYAQVAGMGLSAMLM